MRLVKEFLIEDIIKYENSEGVSILEELSCAEPFVLIDMIMIGNQCSYEEANNIFDKALKTMTLEEIAEEIIRCLIPVQEVDEDKNVDTNEYKTFSDILEHFYEQLQIVDDNISLSEFKQMSTRFLYKYADGLNKRLIAKKNNQYKDYYILVAMFVSALAGKLKEPVQISENAGRKKNVFEQIEDYKKGR